MEKFREALRQLEIEAERFDRRIGSGAVPMPLPEMVEELVEEVNDLREGLVRYRGPAKPVVPHENKSEPLKPAGPRRTAAMAPPKPADSRET
jgi:hypothetical protein